MLNQPVNLSFPLRIEVDVELVQFEVNPKWVLSWFRRRKIKKSSAHPPMRHRRSSPSET